MPRYGVRLPVSGYVYVEVEADDEEAAIEAAFMSDDVVRDNIEEWETHQQIVRGNVCSAVLNEADAELIE